MDIQLIMAPRSTAPKAPLDLARTRRPDDGQRDGRGRPRSVDSTPSPGAGDGDRFIGDRFTGEHFTREPDLDALEALAAEEAASKELSRGPSRLKGRGTGVAIAHRYQGLERVAPMAAEGVIWLESAVSAPPDARNPLDASGASDGPDGQVSGAAASRATADVHDAIAPGPGTEIRFEQARQIIATNDSPDVPFEQSINPYRGCEHGCIYCFARPTHAYLDLSPGLDFERIIIVKRNAAERFRHQLARPGYRCRAITLGAATDPYQPVERRLGITRAVIEVAAAHRHPVFIVTKSALVTRDIDLLGPMARQRLAGVMVTITTLDPAVARILEPRASAPHRRLRTIETLARAGIPVALSVGPVIPFINDADIERIIEAAARAGVGTVHYTVIRLPWEVAPLFEQWLADHFPERADRVMARIREMRGGRRNDPRFGTRMKGEGVLAQLIRARVARAARENGLARGRIELDESIFIAPTRKEVASEDPNLSLF